MLVEAAANVMVITTSTTRSQPGGLLSESATADNEKQSPPNKHPRIEDKEGLEKDQQPSNTAVMYWPDSLEALPGFSTNEYWEMLC